MSLNGLVTCKKIEDPTERVACYDQTVDRLVEAEKVGDVQIVTRAEVEQAKRESFGFQIPSLVNFGGSKFGNDSEAITKIAEKIADVQLTGDRVRVSLSNGQVWVQTDAHNIRVRDYETAEISAAALGSFKMKLDGGPAFRVKRER